MSQQPTQYLRNEHVCRLEREYVGGDRGKRVSCPVMVTEVRAITLTYQVACAGRV
jgi:hypothetical protein